MRNLLTVLLMKLLLVLVIGCKQEKSTTLDDETKLKELLPSTMVGAIEDKELSAEIPIYILSKNDKKRVAGAKFNLNFQNDQTTTYISDTNGVLKLPVSSELLQENPQVSINHDEFKAEELEVKVGGKTMAFTEGKSSDLIDYNTLSHKKISEFKVYYKTGKNGDKNLVRDFQDIKSVYETVDSLIGLKNNSIHPVLVKSQISVTVGVPDSLNIVPVQIGYSKSKFWIFTHELVEGNLNLEAFYKQNSDLRWIGDGLAEYISLKVVQALGKHKPEIAITRMEELKDLGNETFSLWSWKVPAAQKESFTPGYGLSLAYWLKIEEEYGLGSIQNFIEDFRSLKEANTNSVKRCLENNFPGINTDIQIKVEEARRILRKVSNAQDLGKKK